MYSASSFLVANDKNTVIMRSDTGIVMTLDPFNITVPFVSNNLIKIKMLATDQILFLDFRSNSDALVAFRLLTAEITRIKENFSYSIDQKVKNWTNEQLNGIYTTFSSYDDEFSGIYNTFSVYDNNFDSIFATLSTIEDYHILSMSFSGNELLLTRNDGITFSAIINNLDDLNVVGTVSSSGFYGDGSNLTGLVDTFVIGLSYSSNVLTLIQNESGPLLSVTISTDLSAIYATISNLEDYIDDQLTGIYNTFSVYDNNFDSIFATLSTIEDYHITGITFSNDTLTIVRSDAASFSVALDNFNDLIVGTLSAIVVTASSYYGDGSNLSNLLVFSGLTPNNGDHLVYSSGEWSATSSIRVNLNFETPRTYNYIAPSDIVIDSFTTSVAMIATFSYLGITYSFGSVIPQFGTLVVDTDTAGLIIMYGYEI